MPSTPSPSPIMPTSAQRSRFMSCSLRSLGELLGRANAFASARSTIPPRTEPPNDAADGHPRGDVGDFGSGVVAPYEAVPSGLGLGHRGGDVAGRDADLISASVTVSR